ncbi:MAG: adenylyl-sulfate kinase, partial [Candidatus Hermodarchaeota archaeon]
MEHKGFTLWFTGLPCSGKSELADVVAEELKSKGMKVERLDGDIVRKSLTRDLGFTEEDRNMNIERVTFVA